MDYFKTPYDIMEAVRAGFEPFNPESDAYDYYGARKAGISPDETGHWPSRVSKGPLKGLLLKGRNHPTWEKTVAGEEKEGFEVYRKDGRYFSRPKRKPNPTSRADILSGKFKDK